MTLKHRIANDFTDLAIYNSERARGIVHTREWDARMEADQRAFDVRYDFGTRLRTPPNAEVSRARTSPPEGAI